MFVAIFFNYVWGSGYCFPMGKTTSTGLSQVPSGLTWPAAMEDAAAGYPRRRKLIANLPRLEGKDLACWCALDRPCHADVLLEIVNG